MNLFSPVQTMARRLAVSFSLIIASCSLANGQEHIWGKFGTPRTRQTPPQLFLDRPESVVRFQLQRLSDERLLMATRNASDAKFVPLYREILSRVNVPPDPRREAVDALVRLSGTDRVRVLLEALGRLNPQADDAIDSLTRLLLDTSPAVLDQGHASLVAAANERNAHVRRAAMATLLVMNKVPDAIGDGPVESLKAARLADIVAAIPPAMAADAAMTQSSTWEALVPLVRQAAANPTNEELRALAAEAYGVIPVAAPERFEMLAKLLRDKPAVRQAATDAMLRRDLSDVSAERAGPVVQRIVSAAERTKKKDRTRDSFLKSMQLAERLIGRLPADQSKAFRARMRNVWVRMVRIATVEEEMRYDTEYFAVEAGRPVQIVLVNHDVMPHNLVVGRPGTLRDLATEGLAAGPTGIDGGLPYVPESDDVLVATPMVGADGTARITFDAPTQPGEYPYVCTFPQHWYRMYGVMVVVEDLDAFQRNPTPPSNPLGSNRTFVADWQVDDLATELENGMQARSVEIGKKLFVEASCQSCHQMNAEGGKIGPSLDEVFTRHQGDAVAVLREILEPSAKIDSKYKMHKVLTFDGVTFTGIKIKEDEHSIELLQSAEDPKPIEILQDDIDLMVPSTVSLMPKALLNQYSKDEIFEMMAYLRDAAGE
ncbi:MAG: c-type cytochrome [Planctomycetota bacterium]